MKRKDRLRRREKYSHAFFLFGQCYSISRVAHELDIPYKEAKQLHNFYLDSQKVDEETQRETTAFYERELFKPQKNSDYKEIVERANNTEGKIQASKDSVLLLDYLYGEKVEAVEIFFYNNSGICFAHWAK